MEENRVIAIFCHSFHVGCAKFSNTGLIYIVKRFLLHTFMFSLFMCYVYYGFLPCQATSSKILVALVSLNAVLCGTFCLNKKETEQTHSIHVLFK